MAPKVKLLVSYHKPSVLLKDKVMIPIHAGRSEYVRKFASGSIPKDQYEWMMENTIGDDSGENVSHLNYAFNELTTIYWAWKNYEKIDNPDYIGFMHYRRHFDCTSDVIQDMIDNYDVIAASPLDLIITVYEQYKKFHTISELDFCINTIRNGYPDLYPYTQTFFNQNLLNAYNMFIMKKALFFDYCQFLFDIAFKFMDYSDRSNYSAEKSRTFVLERITAFFLYYLSQQSQLKYATLPVMVDEEPRAIFYRFYRCLRDNGVGYTMRLLKKKCVTS